MTAAMSRAITEPLGNGNTVAEVPGVDGPWIEAESPSAALGKLPDVLFDWAMLKIEDSDGDIPIFDGIDLNKL